MLAMHCIVVLSEEVTHAVSNCFTSQMQGSFAGETETEAGAKKSGLTLCMPSWM